MSALTEPVATRLEPERLRLWSEPRASNLAEIAALPAERYPDLIAIYLYHPGGAPEAVTWGELWRGACAQAARLAARSLRAGERVVIILPTSRAFPEVFFGILLAGGVPVPVAPPTSLRRGKIEAYLDLINNIIGDSRAAACVCLSAAAEVISKDVLRANPTMSFLLADVDETNGSAFSSARLGPDDTALLQYTSGSTSRPKGVELTHGNVVANMSAIVDAFIEPDSIGVSWLPLYHDMGLIGGLLTALYCRGPVVLIPPQAFIKNPSSWLRCISTFGGTITAAPNFAFLYSVKNIQLEEMTDVRLDSLRVMINGAEPIDSEAVENFYKKFSPLGLREGVLRPMYGLAESTLAVTLSDIGPQVVDRVDSLILESEWLAVPASPGIRSQAFVSVGRPLSTQEVRITNETGGILPERRVGEIAVRGPSVMKGYFNRPAETAAALRGGWLHTGDLGYLAEGRLYITGRCKDLIIRHGKNYFPSDIEAQATRAGGVIKNGAAAFSVEEASDVRVVVVAESRIKDAAEQENASRRIRELCHKAFLFGPDEVLLVMPGSIPRTTSGKVRRQECKRLYLSDGFRRNPRQEESGSDTI